MFFCVGCYTAESVAVARAVLCHLLGECPVTEPAREVEFQEPTTHVPPQFKTTAFETTTVQQHEAADSEDGSFVVEGDLEPHDYTYWDKLRRAGTKTEIRRWRTFGPESLQDTPFMGRNVGTLRIFRCLLSSALPRCVCLPAQLTWRASTSASTAR